MCSTQTSPIRTTEQNEKLESTHTPPTTKSPYGQLPPEHKIETPWTDHTATEGVMPRCQEDMLMVPPQVVIARYALSLILQRYDVTTHAT